MIIESDAVTASRESKVLRNKEYNVSKNQRTKFGITTSANFAEEWQVVYKQMQANDLVRLLIASSNCVLNVIIYTD